MKSGSLLDQGNIANYFRDCTLACIGIIEDLAGANQMSRHGWGL